MKIHWPCWYRGYLEPGLKRRSWWGWTHNQKGQALTQTAMPQTAGLALRYLLSQAFPQPEQESLKSRRPFSSAVSIFAEPAVDWRTGCLKTRETSVGPRWICLAEEKRGVEVQLWR